jgi:hypothetical protein
MKQSHAILLMLAIASLCVLDTRAGTGNAGYSVKPEDIIDSVHTDDIHFNIAAKTASRYYAKKERLGAELLNTLRDKKSSNANKCEAAYYLGEMGFSAAADDLAANIAINLGDSVILIQNLPIFLAYPSRDALVKIGTLSIPPVIRNIAECDDTHVRELSLDVMNRVYGDKDFVQLRLQKALRAEKDSHKRARLQAALTALGN